MEPWVLDDGTEVELGGSVSGDSWIAEWVRTEIARSRRERVSSRYGATPHFARLDVTVPHLLDSFLRFMWRVRRGPDVEYPKEEPRPDPPEGAVY